MGAALRQPGLPAEAAQALRANNSRLAPLQAPVAVLTSQQPSERRARMEQRLQSAGANFSFFAGLDGSQKIPLLEARAGCVPDCPPGPQRSGCCLF